MIVANIILHKLETGTNVTNLLQSTKINFGLAIASRYCRRSDVPIFIWDEPKIKFKCFYRQHTLSTKIDGHKFIIKYHRSPFWTYEKPTLKLFFKEKIKSWHGSVWKVTPNGSEIAAGFGYSTYCNMWFPRKYMRAFLNYQAKHYLKVTDNDI